MKSTKLIAAVVLCFVASSLSAQTKNFSYNFYGWVRSDIYYNTRHNQEAEDGALLSFPLPKVSDPDGNDLNATASLNLYNMQSTLGIDVAGPDLGNVKTSAKMELDFRGSGATIGIVRMRHVYIKLDWKRSSLLVGQTSHPLNNTVTTEVLNLNIGSPYQAQNRSPQIHFQYQDKLLKLRTAMVWQALLASMGPNGRSSEYLRNARLPELFASADVYRGNSTIGVAVHYMSMAPRLQTEQGYKADERVNGLTLEAHGRYQHRLLTVSAKSFLSRNLTQTNTLGGYGVTHTDSRTGRKEYAPLRFSHSWLNVMYGSKWRGGVYLGYLKNLGAGKEVSELTGVGTNVDRLATASAELTYNIPHWKFGMEYNYTTAWYGTPDNKGRVKDTYDVNNHRLVMTAIFTF